MADDHMTITVRRRSWWAWALAVVWLALVVLVVQTAIASGAEHEPRAALISWVVASILLAVGLMIWIRSGRTVG